MQVGHEVSVGNVGETRKQREWGVESVEPVDRDEEVARRTKMARARSVEPGSEACCAGGTGLPCRKSRREQDETCKVSGRRGAVEGGPGRGWKGWIARTMKMVRSLKRDEVLPRRGARGAPSGTGRG
jgi:hypothetical protein